MTVPLLTLSHLFPRKSLRRTFKLERNKNTTFEVLRVASDEVAPKRGSDNFEYFDAKETLLKTAKYALKH